MAISADEVMIGEFFMTTDHELRKVVRVETRADGAGRVWYQSKSAVTPGQTFLFGHTQDNPPALRDFIATCERRLNWSEILQLRERGILRRFE